MTLQTIASGTTTGRREKAVHRNSWRPRSIEIRTKRFDQVLVAVGRRPGGGGLGLEKTRVETDEAGFLHVDSQLRTGEPAIFAIGDVVGYLATASDPARRDTEEAVRLARAATQVAADERGEGDCGRHHHPFVTDRRPSRRDGLPTACREFRAPTGRPRR